MVTCKKTVRYSLHLADSKILNSTFYCARLMQFVIRHYIIFLWCVVDYQSSSIYSYINEWWRYNADGVSQKQSLSVENITPSIVRRQLLFINRPLWKALESVSTGNFGMSFDINQGILYSSPVINSRTKSV